MNSMIMTKTSFNLVCDFHKRFETGLPQVKVLGDWVEVQIMEYKPVGDKFFLFPIDIDPEAEEF